MAIFKLERPLFARFQFFRPRLLSNRHDELIHDSYIRNVDLEKQTEKFDDFEIFEALKNNIDEYVKELSILFLKNILNFPLHLGHHVFVDIQMEGQTQLSGRKMHSQNRRSLTKSFLLLFCHLKRDKIINAHPKLQSSFWQFMNKNIRKSLYVRNFVNLQRVDWILHNKIYSIVKKNNLKHHFCDNKAHFVDFNALQESIMFQQFPPQCWNSCKQCERKVLSQQQNYCKFYNIALGKTNSATVKETLLLLI